MWVSDELQAILDQLTGRQALAVERIVRAEIEGRSLTSLLEGTDKICAWKTYHGSGKSKGWKRKPAFQQALALARRDYRTWLLEHGTEEALTILADTAPDASRALRQRVVGDELALAALAAMLEDADPRVRGVAARQLGRTGLPRATMALVAALETEVDARVRGVLTEALGEIAGGLGRDTKSAESVLDRAAVETASKSQQSLSLPGFEQALSRVYGDDDGTDETE